MDFRCRKGGVVMEKYFSNPELKKTSIITIMLTILSLIECFAIVNISYNKMKISFVENNMAIVGKISHKYPYLIEEIVPIITKEANSENIKEGKLILSEYGYNERMEIDLLAPMRNSYHISLKFIMLSIGFCFTVIFILNSYEYINIYKKLEGIIIAAQNMIEQNFDIGICGDEEGTFAKLSYEFSNMRRIMKNNFSEIQKEKEFLVQTLSDISHQIKTPIASLILYNDILLNRKVNEDKRKEFLENSKEQLNRIEWLVKSLLQLAKLDAGVIKFEKNISDINDTVEEAVSVLKLKAQNKNIRLIFKKSNEPIFIEHDANWLCEGFINIIKNALEHTQCGGKVEIIMEKSSICARILIKDNGEGIPNDEIPNIFKRFYKGKKSRKGESVGIGLALSKSIIEGHGGMINVKSEEKEGTIFTITFLFYMPKV